MEPRQQYYLNSMGITLWQDKHAQLQPVKKSPAPKKPDELSWSELEQTIRQCQLCNLCHSRTQTVFGVGDPNADLMFIGEAPGANEDRQGKPFVGRAGYLLDQMLAAFDMHRDQVFIANVLKCRPPQNRDPSAEEISQCTPYLEQQVKLIKPKLLIALGRIPASYLLGIKTPLWQMRGQRYEFGEDKIPLVVTYHPAYLLRTPRDKGKAFRDLQNAVSLLRSN